MKRWMLYVLCFASVFAAVLFALCSRLRHDETGSGSAMSAQSASLPRVKAEFSVESVKDAVVRLKGANMADSAEIACAMLANLSSAQDVSVGKKEVIDLLDVVEELESRQIALSNGVSAAARNFARLEGPDFKSSVDAICALRLFCAIASARLGGTGDVGSELWLVDSLTRAKTQLGKGAAKDMTDLLDLWIAKVWDFVDTHECNSYKMTRKLWDDALPHILKGDTDDNYRQEFVGHVRRAFIDRIEKMSGGHIVPWEEEFTFSALVDRITTYQNTK